MEKKRISWALRLPPCPAFDVEGTESWLSDMARQGYFLSESGFFAGVAIFTRGKPENRIYRLEAAPKPTGLLSAGGGEPPAEAVELNREYGWIYVANRGEFHIYCSSGVENRELNTDPAVQAIAMEAVVKRQRSEAVLAVLWCLLFLVARLWDGFLISVLGLGSGFFLLGAMLVLLLVGDAVFQAVWLGRLRRKLEAGQPLDHGKNWKRKMWRHYAKNAVKLAAILAWCGIFLFRLNADVMGEDQVSIGDYTGEIPFATIADFAPEGRNYRPFMTGRNFNTVRVWTDILAPENFSWSEQAELTLPDGGTFGGGLYVDYHRTVSPALARALAEEYVRRDKGEKGYTTLDVPLPQGDYAAVYSGEFRLPTLVLQRGCVVLHASFLPYSESEITTAQWVAIMAASLDEG